MNISRFRWLALAAVLSLGQTGCATHQQTGALLGGATGAAVGSTLGKGGGKTAAIILGAIAGTAVGASIGQHMDEQDRINTAMAMENMPTGNTSTWVNPDTRTSYAVTPTRTYDSAQGPCREFTMNATVGNQPQQMYGTACRQADGSWKIVQ
jgi:surface antigen